MIDNWLRFGDELIVEQSGVIMRGKYELIIKKNSMVMEKYAKTSAAEIVKDVEMTVVSASEQDNASLSQPRITIRKPIMWADLDEK